MHIATSTATLGGDGVIDNPPALSNYNSTNGAAAACDACGQIGIIKQIGLSYKHLTLHKKTSM